MVDNTNPTIAERRRYVQPARRAGFRLVGYFFDIPLPEAIARNRERGGQGPDPDPNARRLGRSWSLLVWEAEADLVLLPASLENLAVDVRNGALVHEDTAALRFDDLVGLTRNLGN